MMKSKLIIFMFILLPSLIQADINEEITKCATTDGELARLACYDAVAKNAGGSGSQSQPINITGTGQWSVSSTTSPIDDSKTVSLILAAKSGKTRGGDPVTLIVRCKSNTTKMYINWGNYIDALPDAIGNYATVQTRIGSNTAVTDIWTLSTNSQGTFYWGKSISFIKDMTSANKFVAQVTPYNESPVTAIFDTTGMSNALDPLREACNW